MWRNVEGGEARMMGGLLISLRRRAAALPARDREGAAAGLAGGQARGTEKRFPHDLQRAIGARRNKRSTTLRLTVMNPSAPQRGQPL